VGSPAPDLTVTLVTGDRVTVRTIGSGSPVAVAIEPARWPGRVVSFRTTVVGGDLQVVPSDVAHLVPSVLDPRLFEVSALVRSGLHDAATRSLPLIVERAPGPAGAATAGWAVDTLRAERQLPIIDAVAVTLDKPGAGAMGTVLAGAPPGRVWLDATVRAATAPAGPKPSPLDHNLVQIGAPAAWDAGLSGAGVRVAVLDTGVDSTHPDLVGQVMAAENFTDTPDASDHNGHGTHVASLIAGTGAASGGARRGVAFGASLLSAKVLDDTGVGTFSSIIAGMEWAAAQDARVVNMSLSSDPPSTGQDPLSLAVDALTASHGVLFVVSAGNRGPDATTIGAPGAAGAALTVGAVDGRDRLASFSSRGPRLGDFAIKPDLVAPGVDIVAARAAGTSLGDPDGTAYTRLTGTSMAAPPVAGAAALLLEQHPEWTPTGFKATLMGTAMPMTAGAFDAGAGRLDLATGIRQRAFADPATVGFGLISYPQAGLPPVDRTVTLTNTADMPLTVDLSASLRDPAGRPAPAGMATVTPAHLTVPAHGSAAATVTLAPALGGFGAFAGEILAAPTQTGVAVRVPIGVVKESTRHTVTIRGLDRNGTSQIETLVTLINLTDVAASPDPVLMSDGEATVRVPPGFYTVTAALPTLEEGGEPIPDGTAVTHGLGTRDLTVTSVSVATAAEVAVDHDLEILLDARAAQPISAAVTGVDTFPTDVRLFLASADRAGNRFVLGYDTSAQDVVEGRLFVQPTEPVRHGTLEVGSKWRLNSAFGDATYDLLLAGKQFPESLHYQVDPGQLARVQTSYRAPATPVGYREARFVFTDVNPVSIAVPETVPGAAPLTRTEYLTGERDQSWFQCVTLTVADAGVGDFCQARTVYRAGTTVDRAWLRSPLRTTAAAFRGDTTLQIGMNDLAEAGPNGGSIARHVLVNRAYALHRDGVLIAEGSDPIGVHAVAPGPATFQLSRTVEMLPGLLPLSTRVDTAWTFDSAPPRAGQPSTRVRLLDVAVHLPVDGMNRVPAGAPLGLEVTAPDAAWVRVELSSDDGKTWWSATLKRQGHDSYRATVPPDVLPAGALVWLRTEAGDREGGHVTQTVHNAFAMDLAPTGE
jgi:subtilisin family serine protease